MAQNHKPSFATPATFPLPATQPPEVHPAERQRVTQWIADGKSGKALDFCKEVHQRRQSSDSEALLLVAYDARFRNLLERNLEFEAKNLMELVRGRYPSASQRVMEWSSALAARHGDLDALLAPLANPSLGPEAQAALGATIRRDVVDLRALAGCRALVPEHPLRIAAAALSAAFDAVTSGPVAEEALALPEVSRQSPLAPWKMLVRAIAAYYRRDDALCGQYLAAVEPDSAAARLAPALCSMMHQKQTLTPAAIALVSKAGGDLEKLRDALKSLDQALERGNQMKILPEVQRAVAICQQTDPGLLERLKQHISIRAMMAGLKSDTVTSAIQGKTLKNAHFWRLLARAIEDDKDKPGAIPLACSYWEEFRNHAVHEGWFPGKGPEVAAVYLHMADLWERVSPEMAADMQARFPKYYDGHAVYYRDQPPEIRALMPKAGNPDLSFLSPFSALENACLADPCSENFERWLHIAVANKSSLSDRVAERWAEALPGDIPPLLRLMESAEKRNALKKAFQYMERAEQIDGLNAGVRHARLRLLVSMAVRHLKERKARLAEGELRQIEELPQAQQGDRPAFTSALRWAWCQLGGGVEGIANARAAVVRLLGGELAAQVVFAGVSGRCGLRAIAPTVPPKGVQASSAIGRACALGDDMGIAFEIPQNLFDRLEKELSAKDFTAPAGPLVALGEAAVRQGLLKMAYAIAGAGLAQGPESQSRFLFLRARGMPPWEEERGAECLAAASELARRQRDSDLLDRIGQWRDEEMEMFDLPPDAATTISAEQIGRIVEREAKYRGYPKSQPPEEFPDDLCQCPECCARRGDLSMPPELEAMVEQYGPDVLAQALAEIIGLGGAAPKRKRRKPRSPVFGDDDVPF